ncbi:MAG: NAD-dependent epimerase/dehydratase family protein [Ignavibacteria bacterium]|nr:NAD-dependent epimerase/dehydratase family protein [Ignavibacteria bacterium]MCU7502182.1 NAD-dependent epimerase/dehydratase family protein [Ignavibacteria bacterium]MCU7517399.1 NAD-dependent epimerase/dehydratase family protein [Ignavibacteria bacterium]
MSKNILVTGGAGFIGSHLCDELLRSGYNVRVLDNLSPQVHGSDSKRFPNGNRPSPPDYLNKDAEFIYGDVRNKEVLEGALRGIDAVFHLAAIVGVGQSMYEIESYMSVNNLGTAVLLEALIKKPVEKIVVASSMSIYGEGLYKTTEGKLKVGAMRSLEQLKKGVWELYDSRRGSILRPVPTPESKTPSLSSVYALSKFDQERLCLMIGRAYNIPTVALRFFNVFGTRQSLSNPYTGVLAIFASRYLNNNPPVIFEDGNQMRDFVSVYDVARACRLALEVQKAQGRVFNIGSGHAYKIREVADKMAQVLSKENLEPVIRGKYRVGDIRHCFADISLARSVLGYKPAVSLEEGLVELSGWLSGQIAQDQVDSANSELEKRGLTI